MTPTCCAITGMNHRDSYLKRVAINGHKPVFITTTLILHTPKPNLSFFQATQILVVSHIAPGDQNWHKN